MELGVLDLQLIVDLLFVEKLGLHLLDLVEVVFDERMFCLLYRSSTSI